MNIRGIFSVTISIMLVIAMCTLSGYAQIAQNDLSNEQSQISDLPIDLLLNEMVEIYENEDDIYAGMDYAMVLKDRINELNYEKVKEIIVNKNVPEVVRVTLLQLSRELEIKDNASRENLYLQIAMDAKNPVVLRQNAIISLPNAERSVEFLEKTVSEEEGIIAFQALKQLNVIAPQKAEQISREIIANWKQVSELKLSQALKVESKNIKENRIIGETDTFISTCSDILKTVEHQNLCDTVFFALEDLDNVEAVKVIVQSDNIDDLLKEYCVSQNEKIILEYMNSDEAKQDEIFLGKIKSFGDLNCSKTNKQSKKNNLSNETVQRAGDYSGYTVYRDGAALGLNWHAGLMVAPTAATVKCVIHMNDVSDGVKLDTFKNFMDKESNTYKGVYKPKSGLTSSKKTAVIATARKLTTENIPYVISQQLDYYNKTSNGTQKGEPSDISNIRCDGVVEYCYEYNGIRIYGNDTYWDISKRSLEAVNHHAATKITPKKQAENNMTLVAASMPGYVS